MPELERQNEVFTDQVNKTAITIWDVSRRDYKLVQLLLPGVGLEMFYMFVVIKLAGVMATFLREDPRYSGLLKIYLEQLDNIHKGRA